MCGVCFQIMGICSLKSNKSHTNCIKVHCLGVPATIDGIDVRDTKVDDANGGKSDLIFS